MISRILCISALATLAAAGGVQGSDAAGRSASWIVDRGGYRLCTPRTVFPKGVSYITVCAHVAKGHWRPIWSARALTDASTNAHRPAPVGQVDFTHLHLELQHWYPGEGAILVSGYIKYAATSVVPSYRAYFGCKRCYGGRSRWWTADGGAHWYVGPFGEKNCLDTRDGWMLRPRWPAYRASVCRVG